MATLYVQTPMGYSAERRYIIGVLLGEFLGFKWQLEQSERHDVRLSSSNGLGDVILPDLLFQTPKCDWLTPASIPLLPLPALESSSTGLPLGLVESKLPIIYGDAHPKVVRKPESIRLPIDIFGSAFFMLTRYEEVVNQERDEHERFPAPSSLAFKEGFLERPIVDEYLELLWVAMHKLWPGLQRRKHEYRIVLTHDVDIPFGVKGEPWRRVIRRFWGDIFRRRDVGIAMKRVGSLLIHGPLGGKLDPNNTFDWIMDQSEQRGLQSEFYFMTGKSSSYDNGYDIFSPHIQRLLYRIHSRGHVIGFHPSYGTLGHPDLLAHEADLLRQALDKAQVRQTIRSGRQHYLRWQADRTWVDWETAGLVEDSSVGFAQHVGFRAGTAHRYPVWSFHFSRELSVVERPLVVMEGSLFSQEYMGLSKEQSMNILKRLATSTKRFGGTLVLLWHNDALITAPEKQVYREVLATTLLCE